MSHNRIWVIGGGHFGRIAVERITKHNNNTDIILVDKDPKVVAPDGVTVVCDDGIEWVERQLNMQTEVDLIVPALPVHLLFEWIRLRLNNHCELRSIPVSDQWLQILPHGVRGREGQVYVSHADFICPDNCAEPKGFCTHTKEARPQNLFQLLAEVGFPGVIPIIVRSHQILPGVGGILPQEILEVCNKVQQSSGHMLMVGTACRCHGVVDFFRTIAK